MKNCKLFLLMVVSIFSLVFSAAVNAAREKYAFGYSAQKWNAESNLLNLILRKWIAIVIYLALFQLWAGPIGHWETLRWPLVSADCISLPILNDLRKWAVKINAPPKSLLARAANYVFPQWLWLTAWLEDGRLEISNDLAERSIKPFVIGRRNFLFTNTRVEPAAVQSC